MKDTFTNTVGRAVERTKASYSQTELAAHEAWAHFTLESGPASALVHLLIRLAGDDDTVVASQRVLAARLGVSQMTIARAAKKAEAAQFIEIIRLGATSTGACAYRLNSRVHWTRGVDGKTTAAFRAIVLASGEDQAKIESAPLRRVPVIRAGEIPLPTGPGLPPPSQPSLSGLEPVLYRDPDSGALFDLDPRTGELQQRLAVEPVEPEAPQNRPLPQRITSLLAAGPDDLTTWEKGFLSNLLAALDAGKTLTAKQAEKAGAILDRLGAAP